MYLVKLLKGEAPGGGAALPARPGGGALGREQTWAASKEGSEHVGSGACGRRERAGVGWGWKPKCFPDKNGLCWVPVMGQALYIEITVNPHDNMKQIPLSHFTDEETKAY